MKRTSCLQIQSWAKSASGALTSESSAILNLASFDSGLTRLLQTMMLTLKGEMMQTMTLEVKMKLTTTNPVRSKRNRLLLKIWKVLSEKVWRCIGCCPTIIDGHQSWLSSEFVEIPLRPSRLLRSRQMIMIAGTHWRQRNVAIPIYSGDVSILPQQLRAKSVLISTVQMLVRVIVLIKRGAVAVAYLDARVEFKKRKNLQTHKRSWFQ